MFILSIWLCPVKPRSWHYTKKFNIFGAPITARKIMDKVQPNDLIIFHLLRKKSGIVDVGKVVSHVYLDHTDIWGRNKWPLRIKIDLVPNLQRKKDNLIPLSTLFVISSKNITIEPFLKGIVLAQVSKGQYQNLKRTFQKFSQKVI